MSDITEYERRISAALERAGKALERLSAASGQGAPDLSGELEAERTANKQLEERVRAIKEKQETTVSRLESEVARLGEALKARDVELEQMRAANADLRKSNAALREANAQGLADAELVNGAMKTELDALRALRTADRAELDEILATLEPVLTEA